MLEGTGGTQIKGLHHLLAASRRTRRARPAANGDTFQPQDVALMESKLPDAVDAPTAWVMRKAMFAALMNRRADAVSAADGKGPFLFRPTRGSAPTARRPSCTARGWCGRRRCRRRGSKGRGTNLTYILLGYFPDWIVARMGVMEFLASGLGDTALQNDRRTCAASSTSTPARGTRPASCCATSWWSGDRCKPTDVPSVGLQVGSLITSSTESSMSTKFTTWPRHAVLGAGVAPADVTATQNGSAGRPARRRRPVLRRPVRSAPSPAAPRSAARSQESADGSTGWADIPGPSSRTSPPGPRAHAADVRPDAAVRPLRRHDLPAAAPRPRSAVPSASRRR